MGIFWLGWHSSSRCYIIGLLGEYFRIRSSAETETAFRKPTRTRNAPRLLSARSVNSIVSLRSGLRATFFGFLMAQHAKVGCSQGTDAIGRLGDAIPGKSIAVSPLRIAVMMSFDLNADDIIRESNRIQIRVVIESPQPHLRNVLFSLEVFNNADGKTTVFIGDPNL